MATVLARRVQVLPRLALVAVLGAAAAPAAAVADEPPPTTTVGLSTHALDLRSFRPVEGPSSGPAVYYEVLEEMDGPIIRGAYVAGLESVTMGAEVPEPLRAKARRLRWRWRAHALPSGGDECRPGGYGDSAASVFATFRRGLKWYVLKYVWSTEGRRGEVCDRKRTLTLARDTIVLESGPGTGRWVTEEVDLRRAFDRHFGPTRGDAERPELVGVGLMSDGDQTRSESRADWAAIEIVY